MNLKKLLFIFLLPLSSGFIFGQNVSLSGIISDKETNEPLVGASVQVNKTGTITDVDGNYTISLPKGNYTFTFSMIGYEAITQSVNLEDDTKLAIALSPSTMMKEIEIVADIAIERKTPVAFSNIPTLKIKEELASQDLPMLLNSTPGVYATQRGGGDGDARVTIRGFNQRNVAVMLDGVPVNDMENGEVYWSNWFGLGLMTKTMQVQRGLGASKLAIPSVGGTINILTKGIDSKREVMVRQEVANNGYFQTSFALNSGRLAHGWGFSLAGARRTNDGWVDGNYADAWFWYAKIEKEWKNNLFTLSGFGGPQAHGQRSFSEEIRLFDTEYAKKVGVPEDVANLGQNRGLRYNNSWGYSDSLRTQKFNSRINYYHKPQLSFRHSYSKGKFFINNTAYISIGNGGGTAPQSSIAADPEGQQRIFDLVKNQKLFGFSSNFIRTGINNHFWYGLLSTSKYTVNKELAISGGIDLRSYEGEHLTKVYDLMGGQFVRGASFAYSDYRNARISQTTTNLTEGDIFNRNYKGFVRWGGVFSLLEYTKDKFSGFLNLSFAQTGQKYEDYMFAESFDLDGKTYYTSYFYGNDPNRRGAAYSVQRRIPIINGVMYTVDNPGAPTRAYAEQNNLRIDSTTAGNQTQGWIWIPSYTFKAGASYNLTKNHNVFFNAGYLSRATRFTNLFYSSYDNNNDIGKVQVARDYDSEKITALEIGYQYKSEIFASNANLYYTRWDNKPVDRLPTELLDPTDPNSERIPLNVTGLGARHIGIEWDWVFNVTRQFRMEGLASVGDWIWNTKGTLTRPDGSTKEFDPTGVHVGDAAQTQLGLMLRYEPMKQTYISVRSTYFGNNYADFQPETLEGVNARRESWQMPNYNLIDLNGGYSFKLSKVKCDLRFSVLNLLDTKYLSDATNNNSASYKDFDAKSATVFFGMGRRWNISLELTL